MTKNTTKLKKQTKHANCLFEMSEKKLNVLCVKKTLMKTGLSALLVKIRHTKIV